ncbi:MAG: rhomboid family intramembrane serine protease [Ferruginibacter sp.]|nr:rhomboid family intramembrane serine protease [Cytophagales bacterium]
MWLIKAVEAILGVSFANFGLYPRHASGLVGVLLAPLIHGDVYHLLSNSIPLLILGTALFLLYPTVAYPVFFAGYFLTDLLVWGFARPSIHIGASGLLYAVAAFLMTIGLFKKDFKSLAVSLIVAFFYSSIIFGVLPIVPGVSWESHLMGALVGIGCASSFSRSRLLDRGREEEVPVRR